MAITLQDVIDNNLHGGDDPAERYETKACPHCGEEEVIIDEDNCVIAQCPNNCYARMLKAPAACRAAMG